MVLRATTVAGGDDGAGLGEGRHLHDPDVGGAPADHDADHGSTWYFLHDDGTACLHPEVVLGMCPASATQRSRSRRLVNTTSTPMGLPASSEQTP